MLDAYVIGKVTRISPEAPVPIISLDKKENRIGGAGNVALNVLNLEAKPNVASILYYYCASHPGMGGKIILS